ncbi:MAG: hypothetical protein EBW14_20435 [Oxalobacteraceae bacterium]|nr:hypothetical protein [Oxalobacteraceae bacterium]
MLADMAIPFCAPASGSVTPPTKLETKTPTAPDGLAAPLATVPSEGDWPASNTGASLTAVIVMLWL